MKERLFRDVTVDGVPKGQVEKRYGRWIWHRPNGGQEAFVKSRTLNVVRAEIAAVCLSTPNKVSIGVVRYRLTN